MELTISGHPLEEVNGVYIALDYLYNDGLYSSKYIYFKNSNDEIYLYYWPLNGEANGYWRLQS